MEKIGRYQIVGELGRGAMGVVYRAVDPNIGRAVALKTMRLDVEGIAHDELLARFRNEARAAGLMNHPNIVTVHDADEVDGLFYIAMEYLEGETLNALMTAKGNIAAEQIVEIAKQVATGLNYAHSMKVVHRDIKPANIMITNQGLVKIMDFGIAKAVGTMTRTGQVLGTPYYMSPEQVMGLELDGRADLFSFGVVLYEMATGQRPFSGDAITTIIYKIVNEEPPSPSDLQIGVHPGLSAVILRCLAKKPEERYQTGAELARGISNFRSLAALEELPTVVLPRGGDSKVPAEATQTIGRPTAAPRIAARPSKPPAVIAQPAIVQTAPSKKSRKTTTTVAVLLILTFLYIGRDLLMRQPKLRLALENHQVRGTESAGARPAAPSQESMQAAGTSENKSAVLRPSSGPISVSASPKTERPPVHSIPRVDIGSGVSQSKLNLTQATTAVSLTSEPPGADIEIDGRVTGKLTPAQIPVAEGQHSVVLRMNGYLPAHAEAEIVKDQIYSLPLRLSPTTPQPAEQTVATAQRPPDSLQAGMPSGLGMIDFVTNPPGANIFIEGRRANAVTPAHNNFPPGDYAIELRLQGYKSIQETVHVIAGRISQVQEKLDPQ